MGRSKLYYKVVSRNGDKLYSAVIGTIINGYRKNRCRSVEQLLVEYKIGEWVKPIIDGTMLCVFDNINSAISFGVNQDIDNCEVYSCHVKSVHPLSSAIRYQGIDNYLVGNIKMLWDKWLNSENCNLYNNGACGSEVKLLKLKETIAFLV